MRSRSKKQEEKAIFYDIFIKPKENKIKELRLKQMKNNELENPKEEVNSKANEEKPKMYISNKINDMDKTNKLVGDSKLGHSNTMTGGVNQTSILQKVTNSIDINNMNLNNTKTNLVDYTAVFDQMKENISTFIKQESVDQGMLLHNFLFEKFIPKIDSPNNKNFFNQLIQIKPPEGINAVVASPLMDSKGWAPSIPSMQITKTKTNLGDLMMRAKGGIQAGDIPKEAHMAFYLGIMNEEEKHYEEALKFYKKYFLSAKLLQDIYGTELALNRIAVLYSNILDFEQSLYYNEKHKDITTHNINGFVASYNCGICFRILGKISESIECFNKALQMAEEENDLESYTICLCQLSISYIFIGNINSFFEYSEEFFNKNKTLKHHEMELEMLMTSGFINSLCNNNDNAIDIYTKSLKQATLSNNEHYKAVSLCNIGIIEANKDFDDYLSQLNLN